MISFVVSLAVLSVMFTLISGFVYLFRKVCMKGREGIMYPIWIIVLTVSIIPLRFDLPPINYVTAAETLTTSVADATNQGDYTELESSERHNSQKTGKDTSELKEQPESRIAIEARRFFAIATTRFDTISTVIFILWIIGAMVSFTRSMSCYFAGKKLLLASSSVCTDERLCSMLAECGREIGLLQKVRLRVFDGEALCSPCVCGCISPVLFLDPGSSKLSDKELKCIFVHELNHIRRRDMLFKLFSLFVASAHWINPISRMVLKTAFEDCELACDYSVLKVYGKEISGVYMTTILDFAERFSENSRFIGAQGITGGLFISRPNGAVFMKRRYANMKNFKKNNNATALTAIFAAVCITANILALSSCSDFSPRSFGSIINLSKPVEQMLRTYYGLSNDDSITPEMVDGIKSLTVSINTNYDNHILADFVVNGDKGYAKAVPEYALDEYWDAYIIPAINEESEQENEKTDGVQINNIKDKINAFYCLKDPDMTELTERQRQEIFYLYPEIKEKGAIYIFDPYATKREVNAIYQCFDKAGLVDPWEVGSDTFDASQFAFFNNLAEIEFVGFTPVNYNFPSDVKVTVTDFDPNEAEQPTDLLTVNESGLVSVDTNSAR